MNLREQLLGQAPATGSTSTYPPVPQASSAGQELPYQSSDSASPHNPSQSGPSANHHSAGQMAYSMSNDSGADDGSVDAKKGKRELSTSKRAAQNRAAQRAFRQRKEEYIRQLEQQVRDFEVMEKNFRSSQSENYQLREYILKLQSTLLENQSDVPPPPVQVDLQPATSADARNTRRDPKQPDSDQPAPEFAARQPYPFPAPDGKRST